MSDPYCFRARFFLTGGAHINLPGSRVVCSEPDASERVELVGHGDPPALFSVTSQLVLTGGQYATEAEALQGGERWRGFLEVGFAAASLGADFGDFAPGGGLTNAGAEMFAKQLGRPVMTDEHGVMAFQCDPRPAFFAASATVTVGRSGEQVVKNIKEACRLNARFEPEKRTAYHLFSSSVAMPSPDARFLTLMTAIETLIRPEPRPEIARDFVTGLIAQAKTAELPRPQRDSILGSLERLKAESIYRKPVGVSWPL